MNNLPETDTVFFDIGSVLVSGPDRSPNKIISTLINLPGVDKHQIGKIIMQEEFAGPEEVYKRLKSHWEDIDLSVRGGIRNLWVSQESDAMEIPGATDSVKYLKQRGYKTGLISDIWSPYFLSFKKSCPEIASMVDSMTLSFQEGLKKPDTALYLKALSSLKAEPGRSVMVGDTYTHDMAPAMKLGMKTVWVLARPDKEKEAVINVLNGKWKKPDYIVEFTGALPDLDIWSEVRNLRL